MNIYIIGIAIILFFVALTIYGYIIAHSVETKQYCGFGERDNCINIIPQNQKIPLSQFQNLDEVFNNE